LAFTGTFDHNLDAKNRLTIPSKFRADLSKGVYLSRAVEHWTVNRGALDLQPLHLAGKEADLLRFLCQNAGETVGRDDILRTIWKDQPHVTPRTVDVHIAWLRQKIEADPASPRHLHTVRGEGYRFVM